MSLSETDTMSSRAQRNLYFTETFLKSLFAKYTKIIIIYDFDLAELQVQTNLESTPTSFWFVSTKE
jgi:hypothetical protein